MADFKKAMDLVFDNKRKPSGFLASFFQPKELDTIKVELQGRDVKAIYSVDVKLGTGGRHMDLAEYDKKEYTVPEYNDYSVIAEEDMLKTQLGETEYTTQMAKVVNLVTDRQEAISDAQRRAEEKQAADALFNGKVVLADGTEITFNKPASHSIVVSNKWNTASGTPIDDISAACKKCVDDGKIGTSVFHLILEDKGLNALLTNEKFQKGSNKEQGINRTNIGIPEEMTQGAMFHGQFSCGSFIINVWSYNEKYEIPTGYGFANEGTEVGYIQDGYGILIPDKPAFRRYYGALNNVDGRVGGEIVGAKMNLQKAQQMPYAYDEVRGGSAVTIAGVKSRPLLVPVKAASFATLSNLA